MTKHKTSLSEQELQEFKTAIQLISKPKFKEFFGDLKGIIRKINDTVQITLAEDSSIPYDFIEFEKFPETWGSDFLAPIVNAIRNKQVIEIYYLPFYEDKPYFIHVHPYLLREYRNRWYLIGLNDQKKEIRTYGLDRIWEIKAINKPYEPRNFSAKDYFKNTIGVISPMGAPPIIKIEVKKPQASYLITQPLHASQNIDFENDDKVVFTYNVHPTYEFKSVLLSLGSDIKVLEPKTLQQEIINEIKDILANYN